MGDEDEDRVLEQLFDDIAGPGVFYTYERHFWLDLFRVPAVEAVEDNGVQFRLYGPVLAFVIADSPRNPQFNVVLGASRPGAAKDGHLAAALEWTESLGVDCRIPIRSDFGEPAAAESILNQRGYRRTGTQMMYVRPATPPDFPQPAGIEVDAALEESEGFGDLLSSGYGMNWTGEGFFIGLPGRREWRSYIAVDAEKEDGIGAATMLLHYEVAQLGFASTYESAQGMGAHLALIRRRIVDARAAGARQLFAVIDEPLDYPTSDSAAGRNLVRAGFRPASARPLWRPPDELIDDGEDDDGFEDGPDDGGPDEDHDFELEG